MGLPQQEQRAHRVDRGGGRRGSVIFEFSMLSPAALPSILVSLAAVHWYSGLRRMPRL